jgi:hypothetical protein
MALSKFPSFAAISPLIMCVAMASRSCAELLPNVAFFETRADAAWKAAFSFSASSRLPNAISATVRV